MSVEESPPPVQPDVDFNTFVSLDLRVGRIVEVTDFPEARIPAYKLVVDFGALGKRQTSAQITRYAPDELHNRLVIGVMNLGTKRVAGFRSEFLVLASLDRESQPHLLAPDEGAQPGDRVA